MDHMELFYWSEKWLMDNLPPLPLTLNYNNPYLSFNNKHNQEDYENYFSHKYDNQSSFDYFDSYNEPYDSYDSYESDDDYDLDF